MDLMFSLFGKVFCKKNNIMIFIFKLKLKTFLYTYNTLLSVNNNIYALLSYALRTNFY